VSNVALELGVVRLAQDGLLVGVWPLTEIETLAGSQLPVFAPSSIASRLAGTALAFAQPS
jgi:hypothetical protein